MRTLIGFILVGMGILDAYKYKWEADKIKSVKSSVGISRRMLLIGIINDGIRLLYGLALRDLPISITATIAFITTSYCYYVCYLYYPTRSSFKQFIIESILSLFRRGSNNEKD